MSEFTRNLDDLLYLSTQKKSLVSHLKKNYRLNIHYIIEKNKQDVKQYGGQNKINFILTENSFELIKNSYNLRNRYITLVSDNIKCVNIGMCIENQTIGFIENSFKCVVECKRQYIIDKYRVDLYFPSHKLVIECDENNHNDRDYVKEKIREDYILSLGNKIIRYNPNINDFDLSNVLREIHKIIYIC